MSVNALEKREFGHTYYYSSTLKKYLNNTASDGFIGKYNLGGISMCGVSISTNAEKAENATISATGDKVFLLSLTEVGDYLGTNGSSLRKANYNGSDVAWWTRTRPTGGAGVGYFWIIPGSGTQDVAQYTTEQYIRPVFWVNY